jgi:hypothetical protein
MPPAANLRFGVVCSGSRLPAWQARAIESLTHLDGVDLCTIISPRTPRTRPRAAFSHCLVEFMRPDRHEDELVTLAPQQAAVAEIAYELRACPESGQIRAVIEADAIAALEPDFILHLGDEEIVGEIAALARLGVWTLHQGDPELYPAGAQGFWEVWSGDPATRVMLQRLTERPGERLTLVEGWLKTNPISWVANRYALHYAARTWPARLCERLLADPTSFPAGTPCRMPDAEPPTNAQALRALLEAFRRRIGRAVSRALFLEQWAIGIADGPVQAFLDPATRPNVRWLAEPARGTLQADPFPMPSGDGFDILVEHFDYAAGRGEIHRITVREGSVMDLGVPVVSLPVHMSYPYVFEDAGEIYCIPETYQSRAAHLFRIGPNGSQWQFVGNLIEDFAAIDSTLVRHAGDYWLFCTNYEDFGNANLYLWHAPHLLGPWRQHPHNPVKCDIRSARPAGRPFVHDGRLYRPGQDCSRGYGCAVAINEVLTLSETAYEERVVNVIRPESDGPFPFGFHTLCGVGEVTLVDGKRRTFSPHFPAAIRAADDNDMSALRKRLACMAEPGALARPRRSAK